MAREDIFSCEILSVWIFVKSGISHKPNTPVENPTTSKLAEAWKAVQTTLVLGRLK